MSGFLSSYAAPIETAFVLFPVLAFFFTFPYMIVQYRKYGAIHPFRTVIVYSLILYSMCVYFLTILPLPPIQEVAARTSRMIQLIPFYGVRDIIVKGGLVWNQPATWLKALVSRECLQLAANIVMLVPMGIYLRYYFRQSFWKTALICFLISLFFELTQLSGLYGVYPRPYRLADVDDLICNTFGGMVGFWIAGPLSRILPSREKLDRHAYEEGKEVPILRRLVAYLTDWMALTFVSMALIHYPVMMLGPFTFVNLQSWQSIAPYAAAVFAYFVVIPALSNGRTLGKLLVRLRVERADGRRARFRDLAARYFLLYFGVLLFPSEAVALFDVLFREPQWLKMLAMIISVFLGILYLVFLFHVLAGFFTYKRQLYYEKWTGTKNVSTVPAPPFKSGMEEP